MSIQIPARVQQTFNHFRQHNTLGAGAEKNGPEMDMLMLTSFRANMEDMQAVLKLDQQAGMDDNTAPGAIECTPAALKALGKEGMQSLRLEEGEDAVVIHKTYGPGKEAYEMITQVNGAVTILTAVAEKDGWGIGSNQMMMKDGQPVMDDFGMPKFQGEFLMAQ